MTMLQKSEKGAVLLLAVITLGISAAVVSVLSGAATNLEGVDQARRASQLLEARQALLAYAVTYADNYPASGAGVGHFPCPDRDPINDGIYTNDGPDPPCNTSDSRIGRMPRYTFSRDAGSTRSRRKLIEFYPPRSLLDQQMWYVVSERFINNPVNTVVNPDTIGDLQVDEITNVVAVFLAPGNELTEAGQSRPSDRIQDYLEGENADGDRVFTQEYSADSNDMLAFITAEDLVPLQSARVGGFIIDWLRRYRQRHCLVPGTRCFPDSLMTLKSELSSGLIDEVPAARHWLIRNQWPDFLDYRVSATCLNDATADCRITLDRWDDVSSGVLRIVVAEQDAH